MRRFFVTNESISHGTVRVSGSDARHARTVLRLGPGDRLIAIDSQGVEHICTIAQESGGDLICRVEETRYESREPRTRLTLIQGLPKADKMDWIVEKCTEIGVASFVPAVCERSVSRPDDGRAEKKVSRWQRLAMEAAKQSGRGTVPEVASIARLPEALDILSPDTTLILPWELERTISVGQALAKRVQADKVAIAIGPEGGFTMDEVDMAVSRGAITVTLGPRILRTETAGLVASALVLYELGEMCGGI